MKFLILILLCILSFAYYGFAQSYLVHTYNENDGLSNSAVYDVAQDSSGQLWFATRAGISVYDGTKWKSYTVAEGLPATSYSKILVDEKGITWILAHAPNLTISYLAEDNWLSVPKPENSDNINNFCSFEVVYRNQKRIIFVGTNNAGLYQFTDEKWKKITVADGLLSNRINGIAYRDGKLYIATDQGISILANNLIDNDWNEKLGLPTKKIVGIAIENKNNSVDYRIWLHGGDWIGFVEQDTFHLFADDVKAIFSKQDHYLELQPDYKRGLFYGNSFDIYYIRKSFGHIERLGRASGLITEGATSFLIDREKNLWITSLRGVSKIQSMRFKNYHKDHGLLENEVTAIAEIEPGKLVFGHENGLTFFENQRFRTLSFLKDKPESEVRSRVLDLAVDHKKNIWIAASMLGLAKINQDGKIEWFRKEAGFEGIVTSVLVDRQNRIWVSDRKGLHISNGEKFVLFNIDILPATEKGRLSPYIRKIFQNSKNSIYLSTSGKGLFLYNEKNGWNQYISTLNDQANNVYYILTDSQDRIWVGTLAGLFTLHNNDLIKYQSSSFEINRPVYLIIEDTKKRLWFGTDNGVIGWDGNNSRQYTIHQGFVGQETNRAAGLVDSDGQVWIGADLGVSCYQEEFDYDQQDLPPPTLELLHIEVAGEKLPLDKVNKLSYLRKTFIFHFRGISFIEEKTIRYRFKLEGYDNDWLFENRPYTQQIRYTKLSPGKYKFYIQAQNSLGCWSAIKSSEFIIIRNPFWSTLWFRIIAILSLITILALTYYGRVSMLKGKQRAQQAFSRKLIEEVEKGRQRIASELHDSLGQNLLITKNEIERCLLLPGLQDQCVENLKEISGIISESINDVRQISYNLHPHQLDRLGLTRAIESMINKVSKSLEITFTQEIDEIDQVIPVEIGIHIYRIIQEGLNNIIRHADAKNVFIKIKESESAVSIIIKDDGVGFNYKKYAVQQTQTKGLGLAGIAERVKILKGGLKIDTAHKKGTRLMVTIPKH
jgi:signal transduction histidine kinase/ligand-binding sensor domain-containing protein